MHRTMLGTVATITRSLILLNPAIEVAGCSVERCPATSGGEDVDMLSVGGTVVSSCMLGAGIWGTYGKQVAKLH